MMKLLQKIEPLMREYRQMEIEQTLDWQKFNLYSIVHHSTSIEGASLTEEETQVLLDENLTAKGKPIEHHHMQLDHYKALLFVLESAKNKTVITPDFIMTIAASVMKNTGKNHHTISGNFDSSKGELRLLNVFAGDTRFVDFSKVPKLIDLFCNEISEKIGTIKDDQDAIITSFDAHFNLVSIHPFADGNGRTSRLIMNFIQHYFNLPLSIVFKEDKAEYYKALSDSRKNENLDCFRDFMIKQYLKMLKIEIEKVKKAQKSHVIKSKKKNSPGLSMIF